MQVDQLKAEQVKTNLPDVQIGDSVRIGLLVSGPLVQSQGSEGVGS